MPTALRNLFAKVLVYCEPKNPEQLWLKFEDFLPEDYQQNKTLSSEDIKSKVINSIADHLCSMGKTLSDYFSASTITVSPTVEGFMKELRDEYEVAILKEDLLAHDQSNKEQKIAYNRIMHHVNKNLPNVFFVDGPGGTGKTFIYKALLASIRSAGHISLATATLGVATSLLPGWRTSHSRFKIPLEDNNSKACNVHKQSTLAHLIRQEKLIIWDEATMAKRSVIEKFNELLKGIMNCEQNFGGKVVVFRGDFRQTLTVTVKGTKDVRINASIIMSPLWNQFEKLWLTKNMCALLDPKFSSYLLNIGDGLEQANEKGEIQIPLASNILFSNDLLL